MSYLTELQEEHVDEAAKVLTRSFLHLNDIWKRYNPTYQQIFPIMRAKIIPSLSGGTSYVLIDKKKIIGVSIQYQLLDYMRMPSLPSNLTLFKNLAKAGTQLEAQLDLSNMKRGQNAYGLYGVIDPDYAKSGHSLKFWWLQFAIGQQIGWKYYYSRISSPISLKMLMKLGAEVLGEAVVDGSQGKQKLWMIRLNLKNIPTLEMMKQFSMKNSHL